MAPLVLEGATLGKRHQLYNQLLKDIPTSEAGPAKIDYNKTDIENLFNIDIACKNRNVEYILDVLKGEDMLYVSRAIKRSNWLITEPQFAHIIEPEYLHSQLFPHMMPKASNKLLLHIRLTLKDESRVDKFYQYYQEKDLKTAMKWLPNCPISVIEESIKKHKLEISPDVFGRLCRRSPKMLKVFSESTDENNYTGAHLEKVMFLINTDTEVYLDAVEKMDKYYPPKLKRKYTDIVMKKCPQRIVNNFEKYSICIHVDTFAKNLKKEDIKTFIRTQLENTSLKSWFDQETLGVFIKYMPKEDKAEFMKQCIDKIVANDTQNDVVAYECAMSCRIGGSSNSSAYRWYKYASFDVAFPEIKKLIRAESNPDERIAMLMLLVGNARNNVNNIKTLLQHYKEKHINEPFRFKVQFVNEFIHKTDPKVYNEDIWGILDELFRSMEVYIESKNNVQTCIKAIIVHKVTHDQAVPDIIQKKFVFDDLKRYEKKLKGTQREKVFNYLFNLILTKLDGHVISHQTEFAEYVEFIKQGLHLLNIWKKDLGDYPLLINKIKYCVKTKKKEKGWSTLLTSLYDVKKSWKRDLFEESLALFPFEGVCVNALKHDPELLVRYKDELDTVRYNDTTPMERVLHKLRVYWPQTLAREWTAAYRERLDKPGGHKALVRGLYCLLNQQELLEFLKKYEPQQTKINWTDADELQMSLHKNIAQNMQIARPQVTPDAVLWYAKGDYVQFAQPALNSILYNLRSGHSHDCVLKLLNGTVALQKHGLRLAFAKLSSSDMNKIFADVWKTTKNSSVRALLFQNTNKVLCKEHDETLIAETWKLMKSFIDSLSAEEDKTIYYTFGKLAKIHQSIKPAYCMKSYKFLKSLPPKVDCKNVIQKMKEEMPNIVNELDPDFVTSIIEEYTNEILVKQGWEYGHRHDINLLTSYLLSAGDENDQTTRFNKAFVPLIDKSMASWNKVVKRQVVVKENFEEIIKELMRSTPDYFVYKNKAKPSSLYINILQKLETTLPVTQNMILFRQLKLGAAFVDVLEKNKSSPVTGKSQLHELYLTSLEDLIKIIIKYLKEDVAEYDTLVYRPFTKAVEKVFDYFDIQSSANLKCIRRMLDEKDFVPLYLVAIKMLPTYYEDNTKQMTKEIRELLTSHPSPLVQLNYHMKCGTYSIPVPEDE